MPLKKLDKLNKEFESMDTGTIDLNVPKGSKLYTEIRHMKRHAHFFSSR